eukprot:4150572-Pleurochrysis_carterae.AAC.2
MTFISNRQSRIQAPFVAVRVRHERPSPEQNSANLTWREESTSSLGMHALDRKVLQAAAGFGQASRKREQRAIEHADQSGQGSCVLKTCSHASFAKCGPRAWTACFFHKPNGSPSGDCVLKVVRERGEATAGVSQKRAACVQIERALTLVNAARSVSLNVEDPKRAQDDGHLFHPGARALLWRKRPDSRSRDGGERQGGRGESRRGVKQEEAILERLGLFVAGTRLRARRYTLRSAAAAVRSSRVSTPGASCGEAARRGIYKPLLVHVYPGSNPALNMSSTAAMHQLHESGIFDRFRCCHRSGPIPERLLPHPHAPPR